MFSISVKNNIVSGFQTGATLPPGNIEIDQAMRDTLKALKQQARAEGRDISVTWNDGAPSLVADSRLVVQLQVNGGTTNTRVNVNEAFTVTVTAPNNPGFNGVRIFRWFDRLFKIQFSSGVGAKVISSAKSLEYTIGGTEEYSANSITIQIVE
jgi:hypothetical protein